MKPRALFVFSCALLAVSSAVFPNTAAADEGMWLYSAPPREQINAKYGFELTDAWLEHLMKASVRFNSHYSCT